MSKQNKTNLDKLFIAVREAVGALGDRWEDEQKYEDIKDYEAAANAILKPFKAVVSKMHKKPFGFEFTYEGILLLMSVNAKGTVTMKQVHATKPTHETAKGKKAIEKAAKTGKPVQLADDVTVMPGGATMSTKNLAAAQAREKRDSAKGGKPVIKLTKTERAAAKVDSKRAAKVVKAVKAATAVENPVTPLTTLLIKAGFVYTKSENVDDRDVAHGYAHPDGSAAIFIHSGTSTAVGARWIVVRGDKKLEGTTAKQLATALYAPALPAATLSAVALLHKLTNGTYRLRALAGDSAYKARLQLLKCLLDTDKVLVKQSGVTNLVKAFHEALQVPTASAAAMDADFELKCGLLLKQQYKAEGAARKVEKAEINEVLRRTANQREVHDDKPILPGVKRLSAKKQKAADEKAKADLAAQIARKRRQEEYTPLAVPRPEAELSVNLDDVCLLVDPDNGITLMCLEKPNSQGAICVYNNGSRVAAGVVPTERLIYLRREVSEDLIRDVNQLLHPITAGVIVTPVAERHLTAVLDYCKETIMKTAPETTVKTKKFAPPAGATKKAAVKVVKGEKPAKAPKAAGTPRAKGFEDGAVIKVLVKENPFHGTLAERFENIFSSKKGTYTVADYVKATDRYPDLGFFVKKEAISIKAA